MPQKRTSCRPELLVALRAGAEPFRSQIERSVRDAARSGRLRAGTALPSSRALARDLGVSRGVVVSAYEQLIAEGFLVTRPAAVTVIAPHARATPVRALRRTERAALYDFRPGMPDVREFPLKHWSRAARRALGELEPTQLGYGDPCGTPALREALAEYLARVRGVAAAPGELMICTGFAQALGIVTRALVAKGVRCIAIEDPANPEIGRIISAAGAQVVPVPVDEQGIVTSHLAKTQAQAAVVTPAHQFPTGVVLSPERRHALLEWAARCHGYVVEDDYDAEYRYVGYPVGALQALAPERVVYAGSASKILAPALRLGWLCLPRSLLDAAVSVKKLADLGTPCFEQLVYAEFLRAGALDQHLRRMRILYRSRRDALIEELRRRRPEWTITGIAAGLHLVATVPAYTDERRMARLAGARCVELYPLGRYWQRRPRGAPHGFVFGYAHMTESEMTRALDAGIC